MCTSERSVTETRPESSPQASKPWLGDTAAALTVAACLDSRRIRWKPAGCLLHWSTMFATKHSMRSPAGLG